MEMPLSTQLQPSAPLDCVGEGKIQTVRLGSQLKLTTHCHPLHLIFRTHVPTAGGLRAVLWAATRCVVMPAVFVCEQLAVARVAWPSVTCVCAQCLCELANNLSHGGRTVSLLSLMRGRARLGRRPTAQMAMHFLHVRERALTRAMRNVRRQWRATSSAATSWSSAVCSPGWAPPTDCH
jgi:hypothetical protein